MGVNQAHSECVSRMFSKSSKNNSFNSSAYNNQNIGDLGGYKIVGENIFQHLHYISINIGKSIFDTAITHVSEIWILIIKQTNSSVFLVSHTLLSSTPLLASWTSCCLSRRPSLVISAIFCRLSLSLRPSSL